MKVSTAVIWHPLLLGVYFVIQLYAANADELTLAVLLLPMLVVCGVIGISWLILVVPARGVARAAVVTTFAWGMFLFFFVVNDGLFGDVYHRVSLFGLEAELQDWVALAWCGVILVGVGVLFFLPRNKGRVDTINRALNITVSCLVLAVVVTHGYSSAINWHGVSRILETDAPAQGAIPSPARGALPNVVYMVLDGYGRDDTYRNLFQYDNSPFLDALQKRGFYVAGQARANYSKTHASVSATLNMNYHDSLLPHVSQRTTSKLPYFQLIKNNVLVPFLKSNGYTILNFSSATFLMDIGEGRDEAQFSPWRSREYEAGLMNRTPLRAAFKYYFSQVKNQDYDYHRERLLSGIDFIRESYRQKIDGPVFIMSHVLYSHAPFVFNEQGDAVNPDQLFTINEDNHTANEDLLAAPVESRRESGLVAQILFLNGKLLEAIDDVLAEATRPTVIVLQGDHGPGLSNDHSREGLIRRMPILSAFYFSDGDYTMLAPDATPVNTFRIILNKYLQTNLPLLDNRSFWVNEPSIFDFIDVTDQLTLSK